MLADSRRFHSEQFSNGFLCQPDGFILKKHLNPYRSVACGVKQEFALGGGQLGGWVSFLAHSGSLSDIRFLQKDDAFWG